MALQVLNTINGQNYDLALKNLNIAKTINSDQTELFNCVQRMIILIKLKIRVLINIK